MTQYSENLRRTFEEGRVIRHLWEDSSDGKRMLCLYTAYFNDGEARPWYCASRAMPGWLARILPALDDSGSKSEWEGMARRIVALSPQFAEMSREKSRRWELAWLRAWMREVLAHVDSPYCAEVLALLNIELAGGWVPDAHWGRILEKAETYVPYCTDQFHANSAACHAIRAVTGDNPSSSVSAATHASLAVCSVKGASEPSWDKVADEFLTYCEENP